MSTLVQATTASTECIWNCVPMHAVKCMSGCDRCRVNCTCKPGLTGKSYDSGCDVRCRINRYLLLKYVLLLPVKVETDNGNSL